MVPRRIVVLGAGAIGGPVAALLSQHRPPEQEVIAVARGAHGRAMRDHGLQILRPAPTERTPPVRLPVVADLSELSPFTDTDLVLLAVMGHHTRDAVAPIPVDVPIVSLQNGTGPLDELDRDGRPVIAGVVYVPAERRAPGQIALAGAPVPGAFLLGGWNAGGRAVHDRWGAWLAGQLVACGFRAEALDSGIASWVLAKVLGNLAGVVVALSDDDGTDALSQVLSLAQAEAEAVFAAAGLEWRTPAELAERIGPLTIEAVDGQPRVGGSTRHALCRGAPLETAMLHGPILEWGREHGVPTPVNRRLVALAERAGAERWTPGGLAPAELLAAVTR